MMLAWFYDKQTKNKEPLSLILSTVLGKITHEEVGESVIRDTDDIRFIQRTLGLDEMKQLRAEKLEKVWVWSVNLQNPQLCRLVFIFF